MGIHRNTKPYFLPSAKCAICPRDNVPCSRRGKVYLCGSCFDYDHEEYGSHAIAASNQAPNSEGLARSTKGRYHVSGTRGY